MKMKNLDLLGVSNNPKDYREDATDKASVGPEPGSDVGGNLATQLDFSFGRKYSVPKEDRLPSLREFIYEELIPGLEDPASPYAALARIQPEMAYGDRVPALSFITSQLSKTARTYARTAPLIIAPVAYFALILQAENATIDDKLQALVDELGVDEEVAGFLLWAQSGKASRDPVPLGVDMLHPSELRLDEGAPYNPTDLLGLLRFPTTLALFAQYRGLPPFAIGYLRALFTPQIRTSYLHQAYMMKGFGISEAFALFLRVSLIVEEKESWLGMARTEWLSD
jgi:hypothetical protein